MKMTWDRERLARLDSRPCECRGATNCPDVTSQNVFALPVLHFLLGVVTYVYIFSLLTESSFRDLTDLTLVLWGYLLKTSLMWLCRVHVCAKASGGKLTRTQVQELGPRDLEPLYHDPHCILVASSLRKMQRMRMQWMRMQRMRMQRMRMQQMRM